MEQVTHVRTCTETYHYKCEKMESLPKESYVRGYHIYQELWEAAIGGELWSVSRSMEMQLMPMLYR